MLKGVTQFHCEFVHTQDTTADPQDRKQMVDPLDQ